MATLANLLCGDFALKKGEKEGLSEFFEAIEELDRHIQFIPLSSISVLTPAKPQDGENFFDVPSYSLSYVERAVAKKTIRKVSIDSLLDGKEEEISSFLEELLASEDAIFMVEKVGMFFVTEDAFINFAKLSKLSGDALRQPSVERDNYITALMGDRCRTYARKRSPKPAFTAIAFEQCGIKRVIAARSGDYTAIPQQLLKNVFASMMDKDDWGAVECHDWYIDHDISYIDLEFPDIEESIHLSYPDMPKLPIVPGVRLSTGSTGLNSLKATMTWRYESNECPALLDGTAQKHCNTYEGDAFIERVHQTIWDRYGELPAKLAELYTIPISTKPSDVSDICESVLKKLAINKIFMQKEDTAKTAKADYQQKIVDYMTTGICCLREATLYDIAVRFMTVADSVEMPVSYQANVRNALMKAAYCLHEMSHK